MALGCVGLVGIGGTCFCWELRKPTEKERAVNQFVAVVPDNG